MYSDRAITGKPATAFLFAEGGMGGKEVDMGNMTGNCTDTKPFITVKAVFDGKQSGRQAFVKLIQRQCRTNGSNIIDNTKYNVDKTQDMEYTGGSEANVGGTTVGFAEDGGQHDGF